MSGYPTSTSLLQVDELSMDPRVLGCHIDLHFSIGVYKKGIHNLTLLNQVIKRVNITYPFQ